MSQSGARAGGVVTVRQPGHVEKFQLIDRAAPSGWWAVPHGGGRPVRVVWSAGEWRVAT